MGLLQKADEVLLLHNPRCSKSRTALSMLQERGTPFRERRYLEEPLSRAELQELEGLLGKACGEWVRSGEAAFGELGLGPNSSREELLDALVKEPVLMQRPVVIHGGEAVVARPPSNLLQLFEED